MRPHSLTAMAGGAVVVLLTLTIALVGLLTGAPPASAVSTQTLFVTGYSYWDNDPPGSAAIAYPGLHRQASGTGTYADPITAAVADSSGIAPGTRFYVPNLRRYVIVEDECATCKAAQVDLWVDGVANEAVSEDCMANITGDHVVVRDPAAGYPVVPGPISGATACAREYGDAIPALQGTVPSTAPTTSLTTTTTARVTTAQANAPTIQANAPTTQANAPTTQAMTRAPITVTPSTTASRATAAALVNVARRADVQVRASSQNWDTGQTAGKAVDGIAQGYPVDHTAEWATPGGGAGSWIELRWNAPVALAQVRLFDRPNLDDQVVAGRLRFSDGSTISVGSLNNAGGATTVSFTERRVTSVRIEISQVSGRTANVGFSEVEALARG